ncbi:MAG: YjcQ family protein [Oscillospiraceae bacterium]|nr:YjcQ family protein [Oscillospiraceae bacterium]
MYKILKALEKAMELEEVPADLLTPEHFGVVPPLFARLIEELVRKEYRQPPSWNSSSGQWNVKYARRSA